MVGSKVDLDSNPFSLSLPCPKPWPDVRLMYKNPAFDSSWADVDPHQTMSPMQNPGNVIYLDNMGIWVRIQLDPDWSWTWRSGSKPNFHHNRKDLYLDFLGPVWVMGAHWQPNWRVHQRTDISYLRKVKRCLSALERWEESWYGYQNHTMHWCLSHFL